MGNSNAARWASRWAQPRNFQSKIEIRSANMDAAQAAHENLVQAHDRAVYTAFPSGMGLDYRPGGKSTLGNVRSVQSTMKTNTGE